MKPHTRRDWAWEFLRRNTSFQHDLVHALEHASYTEAQPSFAVIESGVDMARLGGAVSPVHWKVTRLSSGARVVTRKSCRSSPTRLPRGQRRRHSI